MVTIPAIHPVLNFERSLDDNNNMNKFYDTINKANKPGKTRIRAGISGPVLTGLALAGLVLSACGSTAAKAPVAHKSGPHYGWDVTNYDRIHNLTPKLILPYVGQATPSITKFAEENGAYYESVINPANWVKYPALAGYVYVGKYRGADAAKIELSKRAFGRQAFELFAYSQNLTAAQLIQKSVQLGYSFNYSPSFQSNYTSSVVELQSLAKTQTLAFTYP